MNLLSKVLLLATSLSIFPGISGKTQNYPDISGGQVANTSTDQLKGKVKSITEIGYDAIGKFGEIFKDNVTHRIIYKYDIKGNRTEVQWFGRRKHTVIYDSKNKIIEEIWVDQESGIFEGRYVSAYDERGNKIQEIRYDADGTLLEKYIYKYDTKGNKIEYGWYNADGTLSNKRTYKYDIQGSLIEEIHYFSNGALDEKNTYKYDKQKNLIERNWINSAGNKNKTIFKYDANRNKIESVMDDGYNYEKHTYKFDNKNNLIEEKSIYEKGSLPIKLTYKYDNRGSLIEEITFTEKGPIFQKKEWRYDKIGNWIKETVLENSKVTIIKERKIDYYYDDEELTYQSGLNPAKEVPSIIDSARIIKNALNSRGVYAYGDFQFLNLTDKNIKLALCYPMGPNDWYSFGWFNIVAGGFLNYHNKCASPELYFYAFSDDKQFAADNNIYEFAVDLHNGNFEFHKQRNPDGVTKMNFIDIVYLGRKNWPYQLIFK